MTLFNVDGNFIAVDLITDAEGGGGTVATDGDLAYWDYFGDLDLYFAVKAGFDSIGFGQDIIDDLNGLSGTLDVHLDDFNGVTLVDVPAKLGYLYDFIDLGYGHLGEMLEQLENLLITLENNFELLNQPLPLINKSVGELLGLSSGFSVAVNSFIAELENAASLLDPDEPDVPTLTLQGIAQALRGAFGLEDDSTGIVVNLIDGDDTPNTGDEMLTIEFDLAEAISSTVGLDVDLGDDLPNLTSGKILEVSGDLGLDFKIGIDLDELGYYDTNDNYVPSDIYLFNPDGGLDASLSVLGDGAEGLGLTFLAMIDELPVQVRDGIVDMKLEFSLGGRTFQERRFQA